MVDLKINLLPAASPRDFFCSPHTAETCGTWGGGPWQDVWGSQQPNKHQGSLGMFGVEKLRDVLFEIGQGFLSMAILFLQHFFKVLFNASSSQNGDLEVVTSFPLLKRDASFTCTDRSTIKIVLAGTNWDITKFNWNSSTIQRCWTRCNHQSSLSTPRSSVKQRWKENTHTHTK